jgi:hypothetical protein
MKLRVLLFCLLGGMPLLLPAAGAGHALWWYLSGVVLAAAFVPVALFGPTTASGLFGVVCPVLFVVTVLTTWSEALIFVKSPLIQEHRVANLLGATVTYVLAATVVAILGRALKLTRPSAVRTARWPVSKATRMVLLCAVAYVVFYLVFGTITYQLFTKAYYQDATAIVMRLGAWFWAIQFARGLLMTLAVVPAIYTLRMERWQVALSAGLLMWTAGGLSPLMVPNELMTTTQRVIHIVEIFTQNCSLGITAGLLLRPKRIDHVGVSERILN